MKTLIEVILYSIAIVICYEAMTDQINEISNRKDTWNVPREHLKNIRDVFMGEKNITTWKDLKILMKDIILSPVNLWDVCEQELAILLGLSKYGEENKAQLKLYK